LSWIYFIQEGADGPIKIGRSSDPWKRVDALQAGNPRHLRLIACERIGKAAHIRERDLRREYRATQLVGEWHGTTPELLAEADSVGLPACEECGTAEPRLHIWSKDYGKPEVAVCFKCLNARERTRIAREEAASEARSAAVQAEQALRRLRS
jgi:hypothetical protein